jgi:protein-tyrosine phosphatase
MRSELGEQVDIASAGLSALVDHPMEDNAKALVTSAGIDASGHRARQVTAEIVRDSDMILVMEPGHESALLELTPFARGRVFLLGKWSQDRPIPDPYRRSSEYFKYVYEMIQQDVTHWSDFLRQQ